jgi:hypothetical protein
MLKYLVASFIRFTFALNLKPNQMELSTKTLIEILKFSRYGDVSNKRKLLVKDLCDKLENYVDFDITLKQAEAMEELTARQKTWLRQIFNFKLI